MKKFEKTIKEGTSVKIIGTNSFHKVTGIHSSRQWVQVENFIGSFQRLDIEKYTNKA